MTLPGAVRLWWPLVVLVFWCSGVLDPDCLTFAGLSLLQQLQDGSLRLLQPVLEGLVADGVLT